MTTLYGQLVEMVREHARGGMLPDHLIDMPLTPQTRVSDLGVDSLGKMALLTALMDLTDKYLPDNALNDDQTLAEIAEIAGS
jgi:acyl carrier protein